MRLSLLPPKRKALRQLLKRITLAWSLDFRFQIAHRIQKLGLKGTNWTILFLSFFPGPKTEAHGRIAIECGVGFQYQDPNREPDHTMGGEFGEITLWTIQTKVLHGIPSKRRTTQPQGQYPILHRTLNPPSPLLLFHRASSLKSLQAQSKHWTAWAYSPSRRSTPTSVPAVPHYWTTCWQDVVPPNGALLFFLVPIRLDPDGPSLPRWPVQMEQARPMSMGWPRCWVRVMVMTVNWWRSPYQTAR